MSLRTVWGMAAASFAVSAALLVAGGVLVATAIPASADIISDGGVLSLDAAPGVLADDAMAPGDNVYWPISAQLDASSAGDLTLKVLSNEPLASDPGGLRLALASCREAWTMASIPSDPPTCDGGPGHILIPDTAFADISSTRVFDLGEMSAVSTMPMIATISLPEDVPVSLQGTSADINFGFTALGDTEHANPSDPSKPPLAFTGIDPLGPILLGIGLMLAGITLGRLRVLARRRTQGVSA